MRLARNLFVGWLGLLLAACGSLEPTVGPAPEPESGQEPPIAVLAPFDDASRLGVDAMRLGPAAPIALPEVVDFGGVLVGEHLELEVPIENLRNEALEVRIAWEGSDAFTVTDEALELGPRGEATLTVAFEPELRGAVEAIVELFPCADCKPIHVKLLGHGDVVLVEVATEVDFGSVPVGMVGRRALAVRNVGDRPISLESVQVSGEAFGRGPEGGLQVLPGEEGEVAVEFTPAEERTYDGALVLAAEGLEPLEVALTGWGGGPLLAFDPPALDFGVQPLGRRIGASSYFDNVGAPGHVGPGESWENSFHAGFWFEGPLKDSFDLVIRSVPPVGMLGVSIYVAIHPSPIGPQWGNLAFGTDLAAQPEVRLPISVEVVDPDPCTLRASHEVLDFGTLPADAEVVQVVEVTNAGDAACLLWGVHTTERFDGFRKYFELDQPLDDTFFLEAGEMLPLPIRLRTFKWEWELPESREFSLVIPNGPVEAEPLTILLRWTLAR